MTIPIPPADEIGVAVRFSRVKFGYDVTIHVRSFELRNEPEHSMPLEVFAYAIAEMGARVQEASGCTTEQLVDAIKDVVQSRLV